MSKIVSTGKLIPAITKDTHWYFSVYDADGKEHIVVDKQHDNEAKARKAMADYVIERAKSGK